MDNYFMVLPAINLSVPGTIILRVRNLPTYLEGQFLYSLDMKVPDAETFPSAKPPWMDAKVTLALKKLDGTEPFTQTLLFGSITNRYGARTTGWIVDWGLDWNHPAQMEDTSFDIVVVVEESSHRQTDQLLLHGWAYIHEP